ncbi:hypothetical protein LCGC14_2104560, partial [marine sediment metagenome]
MDISTWLTDDITVASLTSRDIEGVPVYAAQRAIKARVERMQQRITNSDGVEVPSNTQIGTDVPIGPEDRVWFSGADITKVGEARIPVAVNSARNKD